MPRRRHPHGGRERQAGQRVRGPEEAAIVDPRQHVWVRGLPQRCEEPGARYAAKESGLCGLPRGCAGGVGAQHARKADRGQDAGGHLRRLSWRGARNTRRGRRAFAGEPRQYSGHLRPLPRAEVPDGIEWRKRAAVPFVPGERARSRGGERINESGSVHGLPWLAPGASGQRSAIAHLQIQRAGHLREVPFRHPANLHGQHSRAGNCARQRACAGLHRLPRHSHHQGAWRSEWAGGGAQPVARHLRALP